MIGAITGYIVGSVYEWANIKTKDFPLFADRCFFTDDSILTIALADTILTGMPYVENLKTFYRWYPNGGYGGSFHRWARSRHSEPYNSWGNGAAMRISFARPAGCRGAGDEDDQRESQYTQRDHGRCAGKIFTCGTKETCVQSLSLRTISPRRISWFPRYGCR